MDYRLSTRLVERFPDSFPLRKSERSIGRSWNSLEILGFLYGGQRERDRREGFNLSCRKARLMQTLWSPRSISTDLRFSCLNTPLFKRSVADKHAYVSPKEIRVNVVLLRAKSKSNRFSSLSNLLKNFVKTEINITDFSHSWETRIISLIAINSTLDNQIQISNRNNDSYERDIQ